MINKAFLDPWTLFKMNELKEMAADLDLQISSTFRFREAQQKLWDSCRNEGFERGFPVAQPGCSQHEWGFAFDGEVLNPLNAPRVIMPIGALRDLFCYVVPDGLGWICHERTTFEQGFGQGLVGRMAHSIGLEWDTTDSVHFATFPRDAWASHFRAAGFECPTCTYPGGPPF